MVEYYGIAYEGSPYSVVDHDLPVIGVGDSQQEATNSYMRALGIHLTAYKSKRDKNWVSRLPLIGSRRNELPVVSHPKHLELINIISQVDPDSLEIRVLFERPAMK